jgi:hypothetical protein
MTTDEKFLAEHTPHRHKHVNVYGWVIVVAVVSLYWGW